MTFNARRLTAFFLFSLCSCFFSRASCLNSDVIERLEQVNREIRRFTLDNGMVCLVREDNTAPFVSIQIWVETGSVHEQEFLGAGLSHAVEHMIFKGTDTREPGDITRIINDAGGSINAYTSLDRTVFYVDIPSEDWRSALDVLADAAMNASFPEAEWEPERQVILREIDMNRDSPDRELARLLWETAYTVHPHRHPVIGYKAIFKTVTREDLLAFFQRNYTPDNMIAVVAGDVRPAAAEQALRETFQEYPRRPRAPVVLPREPAQLSPRFSKAEGPYEISRLALAWHTVSLDNPDAPALDMLAAIAGDGRSSRLEQEIKDRQQLAFTIGAHSFTPKDPGLFLITASFKPENEYDLIASILEEIEEWQSTPFSAEEVERARRRLLTAALSELQTMHGQARSFGSGEFYARDPGFSATYLKRLLDVTPESITDSARKYLPAHTRTQVVLAPEMEPQERLDVPPARVSSEVQKIVLANGITLLTRQDDRLPFVSFCAAFTGGLILEDEDNNGISRLMIETMIRGTKNRSSSEIAKTVESLGGNLQAFSGNDSFGLTAQCLAPDAEMFMEILADCIMNPVFSDDELSKRKTDQIAAISRRRESPIFQGMQALREALFPGHPYRFIPEGRRETLESITRADILSFHRQTVVAGNIVIAVFGDITAHRATELAEKHLGRIPAGARPVPVILPGRPELPAVIERREPREQAIVLAGFPGVTLSDARADALTVLQNALSGLSSDLLIAIRDERGLAYFGGAFQRAGIEPGFFVIYAGTHEQAVDEVRELISAEIDRLRTEGLREDELERARAQIVSTHAQRLQLNSETAMECALNELFGLGYAHGFKIEERMRELTAEHIVESAQSVLEPDRKAISIVLPGGGDQKAAFGRPINAP